MSKSPLLTQQHKSKGLDTIRILLVDDQQSIREQLKSLLETEPDFEIVGMVDNGYDAIAQVKLLLPNVVLMDMEMPDLDGVLATKIISHSTVKTKVLVLSSHDSNEYVADSIHAGANGYILKGAPAQEICDAVRFINRGYMQIAPGLFERFIPNRARAGAIEWQPRQHHAQIPVSQRDDAGSQFDRSSELISDTTGLGRVRQSIGWYQATAIVLAGAGSLCALYLLYQSLLQPATAPNPQERDRKSQNIQ